MPSGLQIFNKNVANPSIPILDITSRCLNVLGEISTGLWAGRNTWDHPPTYYESSNYTSENIFTWRTITVPEFSLGDPYYNVSLKLYDAIFNPNNQPVQNWLIPGVFSSVASLQAWARGENMNIYHSICTPDVEITGTTLRYRYMPEWRDNIPGDYNGIMIGGFRITYGVI
ncbi:hypothetical protein AWC36_05185 [Brenneria goodwinii]|nr:hypothetical protein AWC36_05185 [Brenneria goodwinii]